ncbi:MAG: right-handed parallel beta-helix repeat-containing protein [Bacteroides stercoris]
MARAQSEAAPGDIVYIRGGRYTIKETQIMGEKENIYACVFLMDKSGTDNEHRICYFGYPGERPVFDLSHVRPARKTYQRILCQRFLPAFQEYRSGGYASYHCGTHPIGMFQQPGRQ